jgi:hypothetical protein
MNNIVRNENDPTVDEIDVAPTAPHSLSLSLPLMPALISNPFLRKQAKLMTQVMRISREKL